MLSNIKTSLSNKTVVTELTHKFQLGSENIVARLAFAYSLAMTERLELGQQRDSKGKEYSPKVLFGAGNIPIYTGLVCQRYGLQKTSGEVGKYIKLHLDDGLERLYKDYGKNASLSSLDFFIPKIEDGLSAIMA